MSDTPEQDYISEIIELKKENERLKSLLNSQKEYFMGIINIYIETI